MSAPIDCLIQPRTKDLGGNFSVRRVLPHHRRRMVGPFIFFDHFGPVRLAPGTGMDVRPHPHIGLATVTYLFDGAIAHKDTVGSDIVIRPGAVNWMTAGRGIVHSERTPDGERGDGQQLHGIQTWVALPAEHEDTEPAFSHHPADTLPVFDRGGAKLRVLAGQAWDHVSPVDFPHPILYLAGETPDGAEFELPASLAEERAIYLAEGGADVSGQAIETGSMAVLSPRASVRLRLEAGSRFLIAGGAPMDGPRLIDWNLVATSQERIDEGRRDWQAAIDRGFRGTRFTLPDGERDWIPLPGSR